MSGVAAALKAKRPSLTVYGVEPKGAQTMTEALKADQPVTIPPDLDRADLGSTLCDPQNARGRKALPEGNRASGRRTDDCRRELAPPDGEAALRARRRLRPDRSGDDRSIPAGRQRDRPRALRLQPVIGRSRCVASGGRSGVILETLAIGSRHPSRNFLLGTLRDPFRPVSL